MLRIEAHGQHRVGGRDTAGSLFRNRSHIEVRRCRDAVKMLVAVTAICGVPVRSWWRPLVGLPWPRALES
jgi:hypothetical protein